MTLVQLRHLIALVDFGTFTEAAHAVFVTQSAFSRSIKALEDEIGQPLFDRVGKQSGLTAFGREMVERARHLVFEADEMLGRSKDIASGRSGSVRVGLGAAAGALLMTPLLREMAVRHPTVQLRIARGDTELLVQKLRDRKIDALVTDVRLLPPAADLRLGKPVELKGAFMCRPRHPLTRWKKPLRFAALTQYPLASTPWSDETIRHLIERYGPSAHPAECVTLDCEEIPSLVAVAEKSDAIVFAVRATAPGLVELDMELPVNMKSRIGLVTLAHRIEAPGLQVVKKLMEELLHD